VTSGERQNGKRKLLRDELVQGIHFPPDSLAFAG